MGGLGRRLLTAGSRPCARFIDELMTRRGSVGGTADRAAAAIIAEVRRGGDRALAALTRRFDGVAPKRLRVTAAELAAARDALAPPERRALELAAPRIAQFHCRTLTTSFNYPDAFRMQFGAIGRPLAPV